MRDLIEIDKEGGFTITKEDRIVRRIQNLKEAPVVAYVAEFIYDYALVYGVGISYATAVIIAEVVVYVAAELLLSAALKAMSPGARTPGRGAGMEINYADTEASIRICYGLIRAGGMETIPPLTSAGAISQGAYLSKVLTMAGHVIDSFTDHFFDSDVIRSTELAAVSGGTGDGLIGGSNKYLNHAWVRGYTGTQAVVDYKLNNELGSAAFAAFVGSGIAYTVYMFLFDPSVYRQVPSCSAMFHGRLCYDPRLDSTNGGSGAHRYATPSTWTYSANPYICLGNYLIESYGGEYDPATEINWPSTITAANVCDALVPQIDPGFGGYVDVGTATRSVNNYTKASGAGAWDSGTYDTTGIISGQVWGSMLGADGAMFGLHTAATIPAATYQGAYMIYFHAVGGIVIYESGTLVLTVTTTPAVAGRDWGRIDYDGTYIRYIVNGKHVRTTTSGSPGQRLYLNVAQFSAGTGIYIHSGPRYTVNGVLLAGSSANQLQDNIKTLNNAGMGRVIYTNGVWSMFAGGWQTPTTPINKNDWVSNLSFTFESGREKRFNSMRCWYIDPQRNWQRNESFMRTNATYQVADGAEWIDADLEQVLCTNESEAQRKAEFLLRASRNQVAVAGKLGPKFQGIQLWDTVTVNYDLFGWNSKTFRVVQCAINPDSSVDVALLEEQDTDWTDLLTSEYNTESTIPLPAINPTVPSAPASFTVTQAVNGALVFDIGEPIVRPLGTRYRLIRATNSTNAALGTVIWDGLDLHNIALAMPTSQHWYWVQAYANSYVSAYQPNTFGVGAFAWPQPIDPFAVDLIPDGEIQNSQNISDFWATSATNVFSVSLTGGLVDGVFKVAAARRAVPTNLSYFASAIQINRYVRHVENRPIKITGRFRQTAAWSWNTTSWGAVTQYPWGLGVWAWTGVGTPQFCGNNPSSSTNAGFKALAMPAHNVNSGFWYEFEMTVYPGSGTSTLSKPTSFEILSGFVGQFSATSFPYLIAGVMLRDYMETGAIDIDYIRANYVS